MTEKIIRNEFSDIMQKSYIDYSMSVICQRAVPDIRDGLKPVQRRVLYSMYELGLSANKPHRKTARIVGDTMGKYHPHGDSSIGDALVVMAQDFKKEMPLIDGHGNFGSIEGDGAAAMRYTEARLHKFTEDVYLSDLDKDVVDFKPNFDETEKEPVVLPVKIPNLLLNGSEGIAVGMTTNIPSHNLGEVIDAEIACIDKENISIKELMKYIIGPDFPSGGLVVNKNDLLSVYESGNGKIKLRGKVIFEKGKGKEKDKLVVTEIPYTMIGSGIAKFISDVIRLIENKVITDVTDISNESSKEGIRIVLSLRKDTNVERLKNILYKKTKLEDTFGVNMLAIANGRPECLSLKDIFTNHISFLYEITKRKYQNLLDKELKQKEIKEGLIQACNIIDVIIEILRGSKTAKIAKNCMMYGDTSEVSFKTKKSEKTASKLSFTEIQTAAILDMRLHRLIGLELEILQQEYQNILVHIKEYTDILNNSSILKNTIKKELRRIKREYATVRKTQIINAKEAVITEIPIEEKEVCLLMDRFHYAKIVDKSVFEKNNNNEYKYVYLCKNTDKLYFFTNKGLIHQISVSDIPLCKWKDKGIPFDNISNFTSKDEDILCIIDERKMIESKLLFISDDGLLKFTDGNNFLSSRKTINATKLNPNYQLNYVKAFNKTEFDGIKERKTDSVLGYLILQSENGYFLKINIDEIPEKTKMAAGVVSFKFTKDDCLKFVYYYHNNKEDSTDKIKYNGKELLFGKMKTMKRNTKGSQLPPLK